MHHVKLTKSYQIASLSLSNNSEYLHRHYDWIPVLVTFMLTTGSIRRIDEEGSEEGSMVGKVFPDQIQKSKTKFHVCLFFTICTLRKTRTRTYPYRQRR